jgi:hypothetical protein
MELPDHGQDIWGYDFSPDGRWLIVRTANDVRLWPLRLDELVGLKERATGRDLTAKERKEYFGDQ